MKATLQPGQPRPAGSGRSEVDEIEAARVAEAGVDHDVISGTLSRMRHADAGDVRRADASRALGTAEMPGAAHVEQRVFYETVPEPAATVPPPQQTPPVAARSLTSPTAVAPLVPAPAPQSPATLRFLDVVAKHRALFQSSRLH
jgi:hypothetical protein